MRKASFFCCTLLILLGYSSSVFSVGFYYGLFTGVNNFTNKNHIKNHYHIEGDFDSGRMFGSVFGLDLAILTIEAELSRQRSYFHSHPHKGSIKSHYYMLNGFLNSPWSLIVTPYVGLGIGYKREKVSRTVFSYSESCSSSQSSKVLEEWIESCSSYEYATPSKHQSVSHSSAWQGIVGVKCPLFCGIELAIEMRYKSSFKKNYMSIYHSGVFLKYFF